MCYHILSYGYFVGSVWYIESIWLYFAGTSLSLSIRSQSFIDSLKKYDPDYGEGVRGKSCLKKIPLVFELFNKIYHWQMNQYTIEFFLYIEYGWYICWRVGNILCNLVTSNGEIHILGEGSEKCPRFCKCLRFSKSGFVTFSNSGGYQKWPALSTSNQSSTMEMSLRVVDIVLLDKK